MLPFLACALGTAPSSFALLDVDASPLAEQALAVSLQGLVTGPGERIWLKAGGIQALLRRDLEREGAKFRPLQLWQALERYRSKVRGGILVKLGTPSVNVASSLGGSLGAVTVDESLRERFEAAGFTILLDARNLTEQDVFARMRDHLRPGIFVEQALDKPAQLRDYAIKHRALTVDLRDREERRRMARETGGIGLGWGRDEFEWIEDLSRAGLTGVPADWCRNLSVLEDLPATRALRPPTPKLPPVPRTGRVVCFVMSDGDNLQVMTGGFATDPAYYGSPLRGKIPMTWEVCAVLPRFAPRVLQKIYDLARPTDDFVAGPGLPGYTFPHFLPDRDAQARATEPLLRAAGLTVGSFLNANEGAMTDIAPWMALPGTTAGIYKDYAPYHRQAGRIEWFGEQPLVSYRFLLWEGLQGIEDLSSAILKMPETGPDRLALVNVHMWSYARIGGPVEAAKRVMDAVGDRAHFTAITPFIRAVRAERVW